MTLNIAYTNHNLPTSVVNHIAVNMDRALDLIQGTYGDFTITNNHNGWHGICHQDRRGAFSITRVKS